MKNAVDATKQAAAGIERADIGLFEREPLLGAVLDEIFHPAATQIVEHTHGIVVLQKQIDHVAPDEPGATGDDCNALTHAALIDFIVRTLKYRSSLRLSGTCPCLNA